MLKVIRDLSTIPPKNKVVNVEKTIHYSAHKEVLIFLDGINLPQAKQVISRAIRKGYENDFEWNNTVIGNKYYNAVVLTKTGKVQLHYNVNQSLHFEKRIDANAFLS